MALIILIIVIMWSIGGIVGGATSIIVLWKQKEIGIRLAPIFWGWVKAFTIGGLVFLFSGFLFSGIMQSLISGPYVWAWDVVPQVFALLLTGAVIGSIGSRPLFLVIKQPDDISSD